MAPHLPQGLLLQLADALARQVVLVADFLERQLLLRAEAKALAQDVGLDRAQLAEQLLDLGRQRLLGKEVRQISALGLLRFEGPQRTRVAREIGFFDPDLKACEDQDYWLRCAASGKRFGTNVDGMVIYRQHGQSMTSQMSRQLAHDGAIRFKISMLLENRPDFPQAGKFYGWLAHAAGSISSAYGLYPQSPQFALRLLDESAKAVLKAAVVAAQAKTDDAHLILAERYFAGEYLLRAGSFDAHSCRPLEKATGFLATRHSKLAGLTRSQLNARQKQLFTRLCCEHERVQATFKREGIFVSW